MTKSTQCLAPVSHILAPDTHRLLQRSFEQDEPAPLARYVHCAADLVTTTFSQLFQRFFKTTGISFLRRLRRAVQLTTLSPCKSIAAEARRPAAGVALRQLQVDIGEVNDLLATLIVGRLEALSRTSRHLRSRRVPHDAAKF